MDNPEKEENINLSMSELGKSRYMIDNLDNPGTIKKAKEHGSAQRIYNIPRNYDAEKVEFCECCGLPLQTPGIIEEFPFFTEIRELSNCGTGTYLYFYFFKYILICLIICLGMSAIPTAIISKYYTDDIINFCNITSMNYSICSRYESNQFNNQSDWLYQMSYENLNKTILLMKNVTVNGTTPLSQFEGNIVNYSFINFLTMAVLLAVNWFFLVIVNNYVREADYLLTTPSDFTLMISKIKGDFKDGDELKQDVIEVDDIIPYDVNMTFTLDEYFELKKNLNDLRKKYQFCKRNNVEEFSTGCFCKTKIAKEDIRLQITKIKEEIKNYFMRVDNFKNNSEIFTGVVFASFKDYVDFKAYSDHFPQSLIGTIFKRIQYFFAHYVFCCCCNDKKKKNLAQAINLSVDVAPEPEDIIWENLQYGFWNKFFRKVFVYLVSLVLISISFGIILGLNYAQWKSQTEGYSNSVAVKYVMSILISCVISFINFIMTQTMSNLTNVEKVYSMTEFYLSLSFKLTIFTFINSAIVPLISNITNYGWDQKDILLNNLLIIFLSNAFATPLTYLSNYGLFLKKMSRSSLEKRYKDDEPVDGMTQRELNEIYENPDLQISYKYSYIAKTFLMSIFYLPLFPIGVVISIVGIWLLYFVEKFNLLRVYKRPAMLNAQICMFYMNHFKAIIFALAVGNWVFFNKVFTNEYWAIINIIVFGALLIIPLQYLFTCDCVGLREEDILTSPYMDYYFDFNTDYIRQNPITKKKGNQIYLERLKEQKIITDEMYEDLSQKIMNENVNMIELYYRANANIQMKTKEKIANLFRPKILKKISGNDLGKGLLKNALGNEFFSKKTDNKAFDNFINFGTLYGMEFNNKKDESLTSKKKIDVFKKYKKVQESQEATPIVNNENNNFNEYVENPNNNINNNIVQNPAYLNVQVNYDNNNYNSYINNNYNPSNNAGQNYNNGYLNNNIYIEPPLADPNFNQGNSFNGITNNQVNMNVEYQDLNNNNNNNNSYNIINVSANKDLNNN